MSNKLKSYARLDAKNRIIYSSVIYRKNKPKVGKWIELTSNQCCNKPS